MSVFLAVILTVSGSPSSGNEATAAPGSQVTSKAQVAAPAAPAPRTGRELADAAHASLRKWAKASDKDADAAARDLLAIYRELQQDSKLARSQRESLRITVRGRLDQLCTQITKRIVKDKATAKSDANVKSVAATTNQRPLAGVGMNPAGSAGFGGGGAAQNANADNGQQLVDLIQNTILPKSWDVNGGNGSIYYWQQQHAIVVRATGEVHDEISDTLDQLNQATH